MNVAVRTLNQSVVLPRFFVWPLFSKIHLLIVSLIFVIVISAFGVVFVKDTNRRLIGELQTLQNSRNNLYTKWSQLLLEESTWASQSRIAYIAQQQLAMTIPADQSRIFV